jgi:hypothetical protein
MSWDNAGGGGGDWNNSGATIEEPAANGFAENIHAGEGDGAASFGGGGGNDGACFNCGEQG